MARLNYVFEQTVLDTAIIEGSRHSLRSRLSSKWWPVWFLSGTRHRRSAWMNHDLGIQCEAPPVTPERGLEPMQELEIPLRTELRPG